MRVILILFTRKLVLRDIIIALADVCKQVTTENPFHIWVIEKWNVLFLIIKVYKRILQRLKPIKYLINAYKKEYDELAM